MASKTADYSISEKHPSPAVLDALLAADEKLVRLDERARLSGIRDGWAARLLYRNACAGIENRGSLVYLEDLVLVDGHAFSGVMSPDLSEAVATLKLWQRARRASSMKLLANTMPGEDERPVAGDANREASAQGRTETFYDPDYGQAERLRRWRDAWRGAQNMPPLLAAATVWDAWHVLCPEPQGPWRSTLLSALVLEARRKTRGWLLPLDLGERDCRKHWRITASEDERRLAFLGMVDAAATRAGRELDALVSARDRMLLKIKGVSRNSCLPTLIDLVIAKPLISIPLASKALGISKQAVAKMLPRLGSSLREISDRPRYRCWTAP